MLRRVTRTTAALVRLTAANVSVETSRKHKATIIANSNRPHRLAAAPLVLPSEGAGLREDSRREAYGAQPGWGTLRGVNGTGAAVGCTVASAANAVAAFAADAAALLLLSSLPTLLLLFNLLPLLTMSLIIQPVLTLT